MRRFCIHSAFSVWNFALPRRATTLDFRDLRRAERYTLPTFDAAQDRQFSFHFLMPPAGSDVRAFEFQAIETGKTGNRFVA